MPTFHRAGLSPVPELQGFSLKRVFHVSDAIDTRFRLFNFDHLPNSSGALTHYGKFILNRQQSPLSLGAFYIGNPPRFIPVNFVHRFQLSYFFSQPMHALIGDDVVHKRKWGLFNNPQALPPSNISLTVSRMTESHLAKIAQFGNSLECIRFDP